MHKKLCFFIVFMCLITTGCFAQNKGFEFSDTAIFKPDETIDEEVEVKTYSNDIQVPDTTLIINSVLDLKDSVAQWKKDKKLSYLQNLDSLLASEQAKDDAAVNNTMDKAQKGFTFFERLFRSGIFQTLLWIIAGTALFFILYKLFLSKGLFSRSDKGSKNVQELPEEELLQLGNYDLLIQEALQAGDYRSATRFLFLQSLKQMSDKEIIFYAADKTNREYLIQLPEHLKPGFRNIARHYDYIWYGHQIIEKENFQNIQQIFKQFNQTL